MTAGRTDEQQDAVDFVTACPHTVVAANDLMGILLAGHGDEPERDRRARANAIAAVLRDVGAQTRAGKVLIDRCSTRVWILRDATRWATATPAALRGDYGRRSGVGPSGGGGGLYID